MHRLCTLNYTLAHIVSMRTADTSTYLKLEMDSRQVGERHVRRARAGWTSPSRKRREDNDSQISEFRWKSQRPHLNWDFMDESHYPSLSGPRIHVEPLAQQERQLVEDLLNSFLGFSGYYIEPASLLDPKAEREFNISPQVNPQLRTLAEKILPLSSYYSRIVRFIQDNHALNAGRVNQALSGYLDEEMQEFCQMVTVMEDRLVTGNITLSMMWSELQGFMQKLKILHQIVNCTGNSRGGKTLTALHENITMTMADQMAQQIFSRAAKAGSVPFFESLSQWIYSGIVSDPFDEFMIIEKTTKRNPSNWDNIFTIDHHYVPSFLYKVVDHAYSSGKYLDAIRNSLSFLDEMPSIQREHMEYDFFDPSYLDTIRQAYNFANYKLLHLLVVDRDIIGRLRTAKAFFSLEHGDLFNNIIENCMAELKKPASEVCQSYLPSIIKSCIRSSSMKSLKYSSEITVYLEKRSLRRQTLTLADPLTFSRTPDENQIGVEALTLKTINKWPDCLIMHEKATKCYQMLFRHLFHVKLVHLKVAQTHIKPLTMNQSILKHCMLTFISSCLSFMTQGTIEKNWVEFQAKAAQTNTVEELRSSHDDFLYKSLSNCMLTSADLYTKFRATLDICSAFTEDQSELHAHTFSDAVTELINAANEAHLSGIEGFIALIQPTYDYTSSCSMSSMYSWADSVTPEISINQSME